jgi:hypothetical protein
MFCLYSGAQETKKSATVIIVVKDANGSLLAGAQAKFVSRTIGETKTFVTAQALAYWNWNQQPMKCLSVLLVSAP